MTRRGIQVVCLVLGTIVLGCSSKQSTSPKVRSQFVGKSISVFWNDQGHYQLDRSFLVRDCDSETGTLCLSPLEKKESSYWVHPSNFRLIWILTEEEAKRRTEELVEKQAKELAPQKAEEAKAP